MHLYMLFLVTRIHSYIHKYLHLQNYIQSCINGFIHAHSCIYVYINEDTLHIDTHRYTYTYIYDHIWRHTYRQVLTSIHVVSVGIQLVGLRQALSMATGVTLCYANRLIGNAQSPLQWFIYCHKSSGSEAWLAVSGVLAPWFCRATCFSKSENLEWIRLLHRSRREGRKPRQLGYVWDWV